MNSIIMNRNGICVRARQFSLGRDVFYDANSHNRCSLCAILECLVFLEGK